MIRRVAVLITIFSTAIVTAAALACPCAEVAEPSGTKPTTNIDKGLAETRSPEYDRDFDKAIAAARKVCQQHKGEPNVAIVSDLDETLLDNRPFMEQHIQDFSWPLFSTWIEQADAPLLKPTAEFLSWARDNGYAVFFVTGRHEKHRLDTIENLVRRKIAYDGLYMRANDDKRNAEDVKTERRKQIEAAGFKIIVSIGDQYSDLYGGHAGDCEKLPNPMYYIP